MSASSGSPVTLVEKNGKSGSGIHISAADRRHHGEGVKIGVGFHNNWGQVDFFKESGGASISFSGRTRHEKAFLF